MASFSVTLDEAKERQKEMGFARLKNLKLSTKFSLMVVVTVLLVSFLYGSFYLSFSKHNQYGEAMDTLNDREREILTERRLTEEPKTLEELSQVYKVSRERVRQIEVRAFEKLQKAMKNIATDRRLKISFARTEFLTRILAWDNLSGDEKWTVFSKA